MINNYFVHNNLGKILIYAYYKMVLSGSRRTSNISSLVNRTNVGGGTAKKSGIAPRVGWFLPSNVGLRGAPQKVPLVMVIYPIHQTQKTGYRATHGGNMG